MGDKDLWKRTVFVDEKKFNLDGPDQCKMAWYDENDIGKFQAQSSAPMASIMVFAGISFDFRSPICFVETTMNSIDYTSLLTSHFLPFIPPKWGSDWRLLQDNAPLHRSIATKQYLDDRGVNCLKFPSKSPDLNNIENLWSLIFGHFFRDEKPKRDVQELKEAIKDAWSNIPAETINN